MKNCRKYNVDKVKEEVRKVVKAISNKENLSLKAKCTRVTKREKAAFLNSCYREGENKLELKKQDITITW